MCAHMCVQAEDVNVALSSPPYSCLRFLYAAQCLDMKRAPLIGDCFLCRFRFTSPHWEFAENNNSAEQKRETCVDVCLYALRRAGEREYERLKGRRRECERE